MIPKEKAKELVYKFDDTMEFSTPQRFAKLCALIAVDEIIKTVHTIYESLGVELIDKSYWEEVRNEIEKL